MSLIVRLRCVGIGNAVQTVGFEMSVKVLAKPVRRQTRYFLQRAFFLEEMRRARNDFHLLFAPEFGQAPH